MQPKRQKLDELKKESESKGTDVTEQEGIVSHVTDKSSEPPWDPMGTMNKIVQEIRGGKQASDTTAHEQAPSSRFVTRMIPMQATCFASLDEISLTAKSLMERFLLPPALDYHQNHHTNKNMPKQTFDIVFKRRNCSNVTRDKVIDVIAPIVMDVCKVIPTTLSASETQAEPLLEVKLKNSDYTIIVEVCRTLCGISIVPTFKSFRNFNLIEIRQEIESKTGDDKSSDY
jgi:tRNA acetyltransferase TAN1